MSVIYPQFGCGLLSIGRDWGVAGSIAPTEKNAYTFLEGAFELGIQFFDTAPSYGSSEKRFGQFLQGLNNNDRDRLIIATKMGEHWDTDRNEPFVDHGYDVLCRSIDQSLERLGQIDLLQLHIATADNVLCDDVLGAIEYAKTNGINQFGASVKDLPTAEHTSRSGTYQCLQLPYNQLNISMTPAIETAAQHSLDVLINRPLAMGELAGKDDKDAALRDAFSFVKEACPNGTILTGTKSLNHLKQNLKALTGAFS